ncbi:MAG TPA: MerR family transcriptional regulator [Nitrolancea sp.]|jgi:DNA-binding transcriptional MerR regulator|nr:MerR family transcriptional regulator [Nitrolancea sp.]
MQLKGNGNGLRVGELAKRTGLTVRALRYYDEIGLLSPPRHAHSDYRLYGDDEIARLQQIASLRQLGFALEEIREILTRPEISVQQVIELHLARLNEQIALMEQLRARLEALTRGLNANGSLTAEALLATMEVMNRMEKYYTPEQLETLKRRHAELGDEHIKEVEAEWPELIARVRAEYERGTDPADAKVQALADRWMELIHEFTGNDPGIAQAVGRVWQEKPNVHGIETGPMRELITYIHQAHAAGKTE